LQGLAVPLLVELDPSAASILTASDIASDGIRRELHPGTPVFCSLVRDSSTFFITATEDLPLVESRREMHPNPPLQNELGPASRTLHESAVISKTPKFPCGPRSKVAKINLCFLSLQEQTGTESLRSRSMPPCSYLLRQHITSWTTMVNSRDSVDFNPTARYRFASKFSAIG
jgi:hypothetical protein